MKTMIKAMTAVVLVAGLAACDMGSVQQSDDVSRYDDNVSISKPKPGGGGFSGADDFANPGDPVDPKPNFDGPDGIQAN